MLASHRQGSCKSMVDEIAIEREGPLEVGDGGFVLALADQDLSQLSASEQLISSAAMHGDQRWRANQLRGTQTGD
jgi:hypothetical protein